jgi:hypothetical protein
MIQNTLNGQAENEIFLSNLYNLKSILEGMQQNINLLVSGSQGQNLTQSSGNLFAMAAQYYGDATLWGTLVQANISEILDENGFINPNIVGINTLLFPPAPTQPTGGIISV